MDSSPQGSSVHGILQARILEWAAISFPRGSSWPSDRTYVSYNSCIGRHVLSLPSCMGLSGLFPGNSDSVDSSWAPGIRVMNKHWFFLLWGKSEEYTTNRLFLCLPQCFHMFSVFCLSLLLSFRKETSFLLGRKHPHKCCLWESRLTPAGQVNHSVVSKVLLLVFLITLVHGDLPHLSWLQALVLPSV